MPDDVTIIEKEEINKEQEQAIIPQLMESAIVNQVVLIGDREVIEPKVQNSLPETVTKLENSSISETDSDQVSELISINKDPFKFTVNLDQWVGDYLRMFRDKIVDLYHIFIK